MLITSYNMQDFRIATTNVKSDYKIFDYNSSRQ